MLYLVPIAWLLGLVFSCIAVATGSDGSCERYIVTSAGVFVLQMFCLAQLTLFTLANKLFFHYNRQRWAVCRVSFIFAFFGCVAAVATNITAGVGVSVAGALYLPMLFTQVAVQFAYGLYVYRKRKNAESESSLDIASVGSQNQEALLKTAATVALQHPDLAVTIVKTAAAHQS